MEMKVEAVILRPMEEGDIDAVAAMEERCFSLPWSRASLKYALYADGALSFAAVDSAGTILGYCMGRCIFEDCEIMNIAVEAEHRTRGIGRALLSLLLQKATENGCLRALLEVRESNAPAKRLYAHAGFTVSGRRKNYYQHPREDALLMTAPLPPA